MVVIPPGTGSLSVSELAAIDGCDRLESKDEGTKNRLAVVRSVAEALQSMTEVCGLTGIEIRSL